MNCCKCRTCYWRSIVGRQRGTQGRLNEREDLWAAGYSFISAPLDALVSEVPIILRDDRCGMEFTLFVLFVEVCRRVLLGRSATKQESYYRSQPKPLNRSPVQQGLAGWKSVYLNQLFFHSFFQLICQIRSDPNPTHWSFRHESSAWNMPYRVALGSWRHVSHHRVWSHFNIVPLIRHGVCPAPLVYHRTRESVIRCWRQTFEVFLRHQWSKTDHRLALVARTD